MGGRTSMLTRTIGPPTTSMPSGCRRDGTTTKTSATFLISSGPTALQMKPLVVLRSGRGQHQLPAGSLHNGAADAFRHCFWSCTMSRYLGEHVAETVADEHEKQNNRDGQPKDEDLMDRANNLAGRTAALSCPKNGKNCWDLCTDLYNFVNWSFSEFSRAAGWVAA